MDQHVPRAITMGLRRRGVDVLTAHEDGSHELSDPDLLDRASQLNRVLFTRDSDLLAETAQRQQEGTHFAGVIYAHQLRVSIGKCVEDLEIIAQTGESQDLANTFIFLPL
jgi:hypothetical protein